MAAKSGLGNGELTVREYVFIGIIILFIYFLSCPADAKRRAVNPIPPIYFNTEEEITVQNLNMVLRWLSDNFTDLQDISKQIANLKRGDTLYIVGE